jgi:putative Holliday junction resolvase
MAIDPGMKRIGVALSDPEGILASPLTVIPHIQLILDCQKISQLAVENNAIAIIVGQPLGEQGEETRGARHSMKIADEIRSISDIPVILWDESYSTQTARNIQIASGSKRKKRSGHMDDIAAAVILQSYLDVLNNISGEA